MEVTKQYPDTCLIPRKSHRKFGKRTRSSKGKEPAPFSDRWDHIDSGTLSDVSDASDVSHRKPQRYARDCGVLSDLFAVAGDVERMPNVVVPGTTITAECSSLDAGDIFSSLIDETGGFYSTPHRQKECDYSEAVPEGNEPAECSSGVTDAGVEPKSRGKSVLLPPQSEAALGRHTLVLDLDETLVHSSHTQDCWDESFGDFYCEVEDEGVMHPVFVRLRPGVMDFLREMSDLYEVVLFTAGTSNYAHAVASKLDPDHKIFHHILTREHCNYYVINSDGCVKEVADVSTGGPFYNLNASENGDYVKDLSRLGRPIDKIVIVDNNPRCFMLHPRNAIECKTWRYDRKDNELEHFGLFLKEVSIVPEVFFDLDTFHRELERMSFHI